MPPRDRAGLLLVNLGTPDSANIPDVRRYLREFLSDPRVIDIGAFRQWLLLNLVILPFRPRRSAEAYEMIWTDRGSPLLFHTQDLAEKVQRRCGDGVVVRFAMRYGNPSIPAALEELKAQSVDRIVLLPLYPQYSSAATGSSIERVAAAASALWNTPFLSVVPPFYDRSEFIDACVAVARPVFEEEPWERVLFSFHGLPERHCRKSDESGSHCLAKADCCDRIVDANRNCYRAQCFATARAIAAGLGIPEERRIVCFQSRLGRSPWIRPYTDEVVVDLAKGGIKRALILSSAFVADCLETIEELGIRAAASFKAAGGELLRLVPSLNADDRWADGVVALARDLAMAAVVVVGGGITGLAAAHRLVEQGTDDVLVLEATSAAGGQIRTERHGEYLFEGGPDALVAQKPAGVALCERIGLGPELRDLSARGGGTQIWHRGRLHRVPAGFLMMAPTRLLPMLRSSLFSWRGKLRMAREPFVPARAAGVDDESLAAFVTRRFGREVLDRVAEPVIAGLFTADAERLSLRMTMPSFLDLEERNGSVTRGLRRAARQKRGSRPFGHGTGHGGYVAVTSGLSRIVEALISRLPVGAVRTGAQVVSASADPVTRAWSVKISGGETVPAGAVVLACPGEDAGRALTAQDPSLAGRLRRLRYASCATVNVVYRAADVRRRLEGNGFFVPAYANLPILACSYVSEKFEGRAPSGTAVFRAFLGGALDPEALDADDRGLVRATHESLRTILGVAADPILAVVHRSPSAMPQFDVGARGLLTSIRRDADAHPGLFLAGSVTGAFGLPDCIRSGEDAAERAALFLAARQGAPGSEWVAYQANQNA